MVKDSTLHRYEEIFQNLNVDKNKSRYTAGKAPHKPILLLALITLYKNDKIDLSDIRPNMYLRETWSDLWSYLDYEKTGPIQLPMYHMRSDGFWDITFNEGITPHQPRSLSALDKMIGQISIDRELIELIDEEVTRNELIKSILNGGYFSKEEAVALASELNELDDSFEYEERLNEMVHEEFVLDHRSLDEAFAPSRDPAFRRVILSAYDETCSVCGLHLISSSGISVIDAAHILPFHKFKNDDIRNGLALCKTHHWLFDRGLLSVDDNYRVMISNTIEEEQPRGAVTRFKKEDVSLPRDEGRWPSELALEWHRERVYLG